MKKVDVALIGASGYTGLELVKILINHPYFHLNYVATSEGGLNIEQIHPSLKDVFSIDVVKADAKEVAKNAALAFLALPHKTAMYFAKDLIAEGVKVVDLSADYRLELETYERHYCEHIDKENIEHSVYGLPELERSAIAQASLVANPGCYPTSAILATLPFMQYRQAKSPIIIDAKSGVSGAGKKCNEITHYVSINENSFAYAPLSHRHAPEIAEKLGIDELEVNFVPHLLPLTRGMLSSIYLQLEDDDFEPLDVLREFYKDEKYVRILEKPSQMKSVAGTNFCDIYAQKRGKILFITSAIDNIMRGASSQAVVNANIMMGFEEHSGISDIAYVP